MGLTNLRAKCDTGKARIKLTPSGPAKVDAHRKFEKTYASGKGKVKFGGKVKSDSSRVRATIRGTTIKISGAGRCDVPSIEFTTKR